MAGERVTMKHLILAICLALYAGFAGSYPVQDANNVNETVKPIETIRPDYNNSLKPKNPADDLGGEECACRHFSEYAPYLVVDEDEYMPIAKTPARPDDIRKIDTETTQMDEAPSPQPQPQSISTAAAAYTTAEGIYYTDDISSGVYEFIPHKEPQPLIDIDMNDTGWLCEPPLPPAEEPILEDGGEAPDPCIGEPPIIGDPIVGEPPLPAEPTIGEPPLPIPEPTVGEPPLPPTVGEPPLAPDPELDVPVPDPVETE